MSTEPLRHEPESSTRPLATGLFLLHGVLARAAFPAERVAVQPPIQVTQE